jgi:hypothetical protein
MQSIHQIEAFFACDTRTHLQLVKVRIVGNTERCTSEFGIGAYLPVVLNFRFLRVVCDA